MLTVSTVMRPFKMQNQLKKKKKLLVTLVRGQVGGLTTLVSICAWYPFLNIFT